MPVVLPLPVILLVDDDATARFLLRRRLMQLNFPLQVLEAENGLLALPLVEAHCQATTAPRSLLVLLDLNMPVMNGLEFLAYHQCLPIDYHSLTSVVVVSGSYQAAERAAAQRLAAAVLFKPLNTQQLTELVRQYLPGTVAA